MVTQTGRVSWVLLALCCAGTALGGLQINTHGRPLSTGPERFAHFALWQDGRGWHIRMMAKESEARFRGAIEIRGGEFTRVREYTVEHAGPRGALFTGHPGRTKISFDFASKGSIDGMDFRVKGKDPVLSFTLMVGEKEPAFEPGAVLIGRSGVHPSSSPFEFPARDR